MAFQSGNSRRAFFAGKKAAAKEAGTLKIPGYSSPVLPTLGEENSIKVKKFKWPKLTAMIKLPKIPKV